MDVKQFANSQNQPSFGRKRRSKNPRNSFGPGTEPHRALSSRPTSGAIQAVENGASASSSADPQMQTLPPNEPLAALEAVLRACGELEAALDPELLAAGEDWLEDLIDVTVNNSSNAARYQQLEAAAEQYFWNSDMTIIRTRMTEMARFPNKRYSIVAMEPHYLSLKMVPATARWGDLDIKLRRGAPKQASQTFFTRAAKSLQDLIVEIREKIKSGKLTLDLDPAALQMPLAYLHAVAEQLGEPSIDNYKSPIGRVDLGEAVEKILSSYRLSRTTSVIDSILSATYAAYWLLRDVEALADYHRVMGTEMPALAGSVEAASAARSLFAWKDAFSKGGTIATSIESVPPLELDPLVLASRYFGEVEIIADAAVSRTPRLELDPLVIASRRFGSVEVALEPIGA